MRDFKLFELLKAFKWSLSLFFLAGFMAVAFIAGFDALADVPTLKGSGTLTSVEEDGSVIIDEKGYLVDPLARITNRKGLASSTRGLSLPAKINFEYRYSEKGFVITAIMEVKEKPQKKGKR